jgi:hypothetical protein
MKSIALLSLAALAVAAPTGPADGAAQPGLTVPSGVVPSSVRVLGISLLGSGCPAGTADVQIDATKTLLEVTFSEYIIQTGPGTKAADWRKNCKLTLNLEFDQGFQYAPMPPILFVLLFLFP